ncbi:MAG: hypothetical protein Q8P56_05930 [Candidatus Uhrbacteria bacterium]|nr:hypothetical protein [Candidatus Uhrbacteria bacterium]
MPEPTLDHLKQLQEHEFKKVFPGVISDVNALCSGDLIALVQHSFEERTSAWGGVIAKYSGNQYLGNFFSDIITSLYEAKKFSYGFERDHKDLYEKYRGLVKNVHDAFAADLLVALLLNRCHDSLVLGQNTIQSDVVAKAVQLLVDCAFANDGGKRVLPKDITLEYMLRAIFEKRISFVPAEKT